MKKLFCLLCLFLTFPLLSVGFDDFESLVFGTADNARYVGFYDDLSFYKRVYEKQIELLFAGYEEVDRIPKVLHFIWFGPKPYPEQSKENVRSWIAYHPTWTVKFWTDSYTKIPPVEGMEYHRVEEIQMQNRDLFHQSKNFGEKADIFRYELLHQQGGVYVDHDIECLRSFDACNGAYDLYAFLEEPHVNPVAFVFFFPSNGLIGTIPGHPILKETMRLVRERWEKAKKDFIGNVPEDSYHMVMYRTFLSFVYSVRAKLDDPSYQNICFPVSCWSNSIHTEDTDPHVRFCQHDFAGSWMVEHDAQPVKEKKRKKKRK